MKVVGNENIILSHEEINALHRAKNILIYEIIAKNRGSYACNLACAITDCLDVLNDWYIIEEDF